MQNSSIGEPHGGFKAGKVRRLAIYVRILQNIIPVMDFCKVLALTQWEKFAENE